MLANTLRSSVRTASRSTRCTLVQQSRFYASAPADEENASSSSSSPSRQSYMNAERKRKLISLYHKTEDFVTHENLSEYIDREFNPHFRVDNDRYEDNNRILHHELDEQRSRPKTITAAMIDTDHQFRDKDLYSSVPSKLRIKAKEKRLKAAVFGVDDSLKTSLEMVEEFKKRDRTNE